MLVRGRVVQHAAVQWPHDMNHDAQIAPALVLILVP